jgi:hypothetical protein
MYGKLLKGFRAVPASADRLSLACKNLKCGFSKHLCWKFDAKLQVSLSSPLKAADPEAANLIQKVSKI